MFHDFAGHKTTRAALHLGPLQDKRDCCVWSPENATNARNWPQHRPIHRHQVTGSWNHRNECYYKASESSIVKREGTAQHSLRSVWTAGKVWCGGVGIVWGPGGHDKKPRLGIIPPSLSPAEVVSVQSTEFKSGEDFPLSALIPQPITQLQSKTKEKQEKCSERSVDGILE